MIRALSFSSLSPLFASRTTSFKTSPTTMTTTYASRTLRTILAGALMLCSVIGLQGCKDEYDRTEISAVVPSKLGTPNGEPAVSVQNIYVPEGTIVKAHIVVWNDDNVQMPLEIRSSDNSMVEVASVVSDRDYAFIGKKVGDTTIQFFTDDKAVVTLTAHVTPQPTDP